jgi:hypothetical protein
MILCRLVACGFEAVIMRGRPGQGQRGGASRKDRTKEGKDSQSGKAGLEKRNTAGASGYEAVTD